MSSQMEMAEDICVLCCRKILIYAVGVCDHTVCYECSARMRVLCKQNECPICRQDMPKVVFTQKLELFSTLDGITYPLDKKYKIYFEDDFCRRMYDKLLEHSCQICQNKPYFHTFGHMKHHMRRTHERFYCDLCVENLWVFTSERKSYTRDGLARHRRVGDSDDTSHRGHPLCEFCDQRYLDQDELFRHLRREHFFCHFCDADGDVNKFYSDYEYLRAHFRREHYLCEEGSCQDEKFTPVFRSEIDLKAHRAIQHSKNLSKAQAKQARTLELEFTIKPRSSQQNGYISFTAENFRRQENKRYENQYGTISTMSSRERNNTRSNTSSPIAGDQRSSPLVQFQLLHSKYHLCPVPTRALLLTTYVKFINLFPEIKEHIQTILNSHSNIRSADVELQQRTVEYFHLSNIASSDVLATVLEEMPPFPERESSILAVLKKKKPGMTEAPTKERQSPSAVINTSGSQSDGLVNSTSPPLNATMDLLGLSGDAVTPASTNSTAPSANVGGMDLLVDVFGDSMASPPNATVPSTPQETVSSIVISNEEGLKRLLCKQNGVMFENDLLQIGIKTEYRKNLGRMNLFYGNKTSFQLQGFTPNISSSEELQSKLSVQVKPVETVVAVGAQVQQQLNMECIDDFTELPSLSIQFLYCGAQQKLTLQLPVTINKFIEPTVMNSEAFFTRWKNLSNPLQESQKIFKAKFPMDSNGIKTKLLGFGVQVLDGIDPNPDNIVCAGIAHTRALQIGCLIRLEPNRQAQMYRLTIRTSKEAVSKEMCQLLHEQF